MLISELNLDGESDYRIKDIEILYRFPNSSEIASFLGIENVNAVKQIVEAYKAAELKKDGSVENINSRIPKKALAQLLPDEAIDQKLVIKQLKEKYYIGEINFGLNENIFIPNSKLDDLYPFDKESGKRWVNIPLLGHYSDAAERTLEKIRQLNK